MQIGFSEPFCTHSNKSPCTQKEAKKGLDFFSIPPYFGTTFFPDLCVPPMYFCAVEGQRGSFNQISVRTVFNQIRASVQ
jgi:hypothetical protein